MKILIIMLALLATTNGYAMTAAQKFMMASGGPQNFQFSDFEGVNNWSGWTSVGGAAREAEDGDGTAWHLLLHTNVSGTEQAVTKTDTWRAGTMTFNAKIEGDGASVIVNGASTGLISTAGMWNAKSVTIPAGTYEIKFRLVPSGTYSRDFKLDSINIPVP